MDERLKADIANNRRPCILCGGPPVYSGVWIPNDDGAKILERPGYPINKKRLALYTLCGLCALRDKDKVMELVEKKLATLPMGDYRDYGTVPPLYREDMN